MPNYLKHDNHFIVWPVLVATTENELLTSHIGLKTRYDMTTKELLNDILDLYKADKEKNYTLLLKRADRRYSHSFGWNG